MRKFMSVEVEKVIVGLRKYNIVVCYLIKKITLISCKRKLVGMIIHSHFYYYFFENLPTNPLKVVIV